MIEFDLGCAQYVKDMGRILCLSIIVKKVEAKDDESVAHLALAGTESPKTDQKPSGAQRSGLLPTWIVPFKNEPQYCFAVP